MRETAAVPLTADALHGRPAGVVTRTLAGAVDYVVVAIATVSTYVGVAGLRFLWNPVRFSWPRVPVIGLLGLGAVLMIVYLVLTWSTSGKTIGGAMLHTRVVGPGHGRLRFLHAVARAAFTVVFPIGLFACAVAPGSRSLQDIVLRTRVLYDYPVTKPPMLRPRA